ncbi:Blue-light-activated histidine kinase 2 [Jannaschia seosinensis]|uniref:histidine kinase n=1 Tax=Jannaschia seosinensis TaxID=313367 RepID=A0A0M7B8C8_9RHOB|nr:histidine kinase dimerization/phosphoacceptor domain -containing protein [Jannaschia seosinensis]CUH27123.1 Blue-light-activated histidine kinase 2 [Jannaschia seosinensis]
MTLDKVITRESDRLDVIAQLFPDGPRRDGTFDDTVDLVARITGCPIAIVTILREDDQAFEACTGLDFDGTSVESAVCAHALLQDELLEICDMRLDMRTAENPLVTNPDDPLLFYAGAQLRTEAGVPLGTLCVFDRRPRRLGDHERRALRILADQISREIELRAKVERQESLRREADHRVKNSLTSIAAMTRMASRGASDETRAVLAAVEQRINVMAELHGELYRTVDPEAPIPVHDFLGRVLSHLSGIAPPGVSVEARLAPVSLAGPQAAALGILLNEMVSNACKHAFPEGQKGLIVIEGQVRPGGRYALTCVDDGVGGGDGPDPASGSGLGHRIMESAALQLGGTLHLAAVETGFRAELDFPLPEA